jgi:ABC-type phosphate transport system substrate-binding protein
MSKVRTTEVSVRPMSSRIAVVAVMIGALCLAAVAFLAPAAGAETFGQVNTFGGPGTGNAQFFNPGALGVDSEDGSVYGGDVTPTGSSYRVQKLTAGGEFKASALIPRFDDVEETKIVAMHGIAVDHEKGRFYLVDGCRVGTGLSVCKKTGTLFNARRILAFKTAPEGEKLVSSGNFNLPEGAEELYTPQSIAVDPSNGDIVLLAEDSAKHAVIQRISSTGTLGARFVDTANVLKPATGREATSIAVGPTGITYTLTGAPGSAGAKFTRAWELPANLSSAKEVSGFAASAEAEGWLTGLQSQKSPALFGGPQVAISPDGSTLYWKENLTSSSESEAGSVLVRGYSLKAGGSSVLYGGGSKGTCQITTSGAAIGTAGNQVVVFDFGPAAEKGKEPAYGDHVLTFGPGGSGCPIPTPKFTANGSKAAEITVTKGDVVSFDGKESELFGKALTGLEWNFGDGTIKKVAGTPCEEEGCEPEPPAQTISHRFLSAGKYIVKLKLTTTELGQLPVPAEVIVNVVGGKPTASFTASTSTPEAGGTVEFDASGSTDPTGGTCTQEAGCTSSHELASYHWIFGDGGEATTGSPTVSHEFSNEETTPVLRTVSLVVTSKDGVSSSPSEQGIEVQGAPPAAGLSCAGADIHGWGSPLQGSAQLGLWKPTFEGSICPEGPVISYTPNSNSAGMRAWNYNGKRGSINTAVQFVGTDEAPSKAQIENITSVAGGASVLTIPVAQTSIAIIANPPAGCEVEAITNKQLEQVFRGTLKQWSDLDTAEGTCASPIVRVVRKDDSGTTTQFKNYLAKMFGGTLPCGTEAWTDFTSNWPESCEGTSLSKVARASFGDEGSEVESVNVTPGGIGYATGPVVAAASHVLALQNNGQVGAAEAEFAAPTIAGNEANCSGSSYTVPAGARRKNGEPATNIDWSHVFGAHPAVGGSAYPLCALTYDLAFRGYKSTGIPFTKEVTVRDYLKWYVTAEGQAAIEGSFYAPLPSASESSRNVLGSAQYTAGKIKY